MRSIAGNKVNVIDPDQSRNLTVVKDGRSLDLLPVMLQAETNGSAISTEAVCANQRLLQVTEVETGDAATSRKI